MTAIPYPPYPAPNTQMPLLLLPKRHLFFDLSLNEETLSEPLNAESVREASRRANYYFKSINLAVFTNEPARIRQ